jgi:hypothetical protein
LWLRDFHFWLGVLGLSFEVWVSGFRVLGSRFIIWAFRFWVSGLGIRNFVFEVFGFRVQRLQPREFQVKGAESMVRGLG